jgi:glycosyltransferase involved in cell wall biosynthesis
VITVVVPSIPPRDALLRRALDSVEAQDMPPDFVVVEYDTHREGAAATRQRGLERVTTEWTAFLDDDDEFMPQHLESLYAHALETGADMVFSWYEVVGGTDPRPGEFGLPWDRAHPRQTTITTLVRTAVALEAGFLADDEGDLASPDRHYAGEDWRFTSRVNDLGVISHLPQKTWYWHHHARNTSGLPKNW